MTQPSAKTQGVHHVGLTVPDLASTQAFFEQALGFRTVGGSSDYPAVFVSDGHVMITLWQVRDPAKAIEADRTRVLGLHHLALAVPDHAALDALHVTLAGRADARFEFSPEPLAGGPERHMMLYIPGNIRIELIAVRG